MIVIKSAETIYTENYMQGLSLVQECRQSFSAEKLSQAVRLLVVAFNNGVKQEQIFSLLSQMLNKPNVAVLRKTYEANCQRVVSISRAVKLPNFTAMPFQIFPLSATEYYLFDYQNKVFLDRFHIKMLWWLFAELALRKTISGEADFIVYLMKHEYNNAQARRQFAELRNRLETGEASTGLYNNICQYGKLRPHCETYDWLLGKYYANSHQYKLAEKWARQGWLKRKFNFSLTVLLAEIDIQLGKLAEAAALYVSVMVVQPERQQEFSDKLQDILAMARQISAETVHNVLHQMSLQNSHVLLAPGLKTFSLAADGKELQQEIKLRLGDFLEETGRDTDFFVGAYNYDRTLDSRAYEIKQLASFDDYHRSLVIGNYQFDLLKGRLMNQFTAMPADVPYVLAVTPTVEQQKINFTYGDKVKALQFGQYECNFIRVQEELRISSEEPFLVGNKVLLNHKPERRKLVINILLDALSSVQLQKDDFADMPNLKRFFARGTIFTNAFAAAECTYPSLATIETGCYQHKNGIFHPTAYVKLADNIIPTSERIHQCGYYCVNLVGVPESIYNGISRGYDRVIMNYDISRLSDGVERTLQHLTAFQETDNFINLHCSDIHPPYNKTQLDLTAQTTMSIEERFAYNDDLSIPSVRRSSSAANMRWYRKAVQDTDRYLGVLFDFIEKNYQDDEILVTVYSDHGNSIVSPDSYLFTEEKAGSVLMLRGGNVPEQTICDDMVSALDLHSILGHLVGYAVDEQQLDSRLPKVFGGIGREYTISQAIFPNQPYVLCIRTQEHEFRLLTKDVLTTDGLVNLAAFSWELRRRDALQTKIFDQTLLEYFMNIVYQHTQAMRTFLPSEEF